MTVGDAFINQWSDLKADRAAILLFWRDKLVKAYADNLHDVAGMYKAMIVSFLSKKKKVYRQLSPAQVNDIADDIKFIHEPWFDFHVTYIKIKRTIHLLPETKLASFTFWQLVLADAEYSKFLILNHRESKEQEHALNRLVAIIYQPVPGQFDDTTIEDAANALPKALSFDIKYLILHTYSNCRKYIVNDRCKHLFPRPPEQSEGSGEGTPKDEPEEPTYTGAMWRDMLFDLSETPAFSGLEAAKNSRMYDALDYLEKKAKDSQNRKK